MKYGSAMRRLDRRVEGRDFAVDGELDGADFDDLAGFDAEAGGLEVDGDVGGRHGSPSGEGSPSF